MTATCPHCKKSFELNYETLADVLDQSVSWRFLKGWAFFVCICPHCNNDFTADIDFKIEPVKIKEE